MGRLASRGACDAASPHFGRDKPTRAMGDRRLYRHDHQRGSSVVCGAAEVLHQTVVPAQGGYADPGGFELLVLRYEGPAELDII